MFERPNRDLFHSGEQLFRVARDVKGDCNGCFFKRENGCVTHDINIFGTCDGNFREDHKDVVFKIITQSEAQVEFDNKFRGTVRSKVKLITLPRCILGIDYGSVSNILAYNLLSNKGIIYKRGKMEWFSKLDSHYVPPHFELIEWNNDFKSFHGFTSKNIYNGRYSIKSLNAIYNGIRELGVESTYDISKTETILIDKKSIIDVEAQDRFKHLILDRINKN